MHRFFAPDAPADLSGFELPLSDEESRHAGKVLRLRQGDQVELFDGRGHAWLCRLRFEGECAIALAESELPSNESPLRLTLYQGVPKADKLELIIQKVTELGAARVVPVDMARSVARFDGRDAAKKRERWQRIAYEAAKQCGRAWVPEVALPMSFDAAICDMAQRQLMLMPYELCRGGGIGVIEGGPTDVGVLIGPEGGIAPEEAERATAIGAKALTLGPRILRTETAALTAVALIMMKFGDIG